MDNNWFLNGPIPSNAMSGTYDLKLVILSYVIATLASYVAINLAAHLRVERNSSAKLYWLLGGAFTLGAGIWSMHFIGMLAFKMQTQMRFEIYWTVGSLLVAVMASGFAFYLLSFKENFTSRILIGGIYIGLGIATMHYMGMQAMKIDMNIQYRPWIFLLSIAIAIIAAEGALILATLSTYGTPRRQFYFKFISAIIMGIAICGMHYTGMYAAVFTPLENSMTMLEYPIIQPTILALFVAGITGLIITLAFTVSTYYKKMLYAVQIEKEFLNTMLDNIQDGIIACDAHGNITVINKMLERNIKNLKNIKSILNISNYFDFYDVKDDKIQNGENSPLIRALREYIHDLELVVKYKNSDVQRNVIINGQPIMTANGVKLGAVIVVHDITKLKQNEKIKNEFVSVVSHELRTPLTSIRGSLGLLLGGTAGEFSEKSARLLEIANKNCERLLLLINDILDIEKIQAGKMRFTMQVVNLEQLVIDAIHTNKSFGDKYSVTLNLLDSVPDAYVNVDTGRLMQVLANLISNAVKFSPTNGDVGISIKRHDGLVRVSVSDNGAGIPKEFQSRIFQKFTQADSSITREKGGTGLGLHISKAIIEKLNGAINFQSEESKGSTFYFDLPLCEPEREKTLIPQIEAPTEIKLSKNKLLICEDDHDQANYVYLLLKASGINADIATTVSEAKAHIAANQYQAILLDLILPDQDGISFIKELRHDAKTRDIPIIVMSVIAKTGQSLINGDAIAVIDWLDKPINFTKLLDAINRLKKQTPEERPRVLYVEDDVDTQQIIKTLIAKECHLKCASTITEVKHILKTQKFDLVILDLLLPDGNGTELLPIFAHLSLPVIVYSATELDKMYSQYVIEALIKSKITNGELLTKIQHTFDKITKDTAHVV